MIDLDINVQSPEWSRYFADYEDHIRTCIDNVAKYVPEGRYFDDFPALELSILLTDDQEMQKLNREHRGKDTPTNVLSFPSFDYEEINLFLKKGREIPAYPVSLGDIIFSLTTLKGEHSAQDKSFKDHFCHLCIHGMLHLMGYDHVEDAEADKMEAIEKMLLAKLSIDDPYSD